MHSYKARRVALSLCPWMDGSRAMQELLPRERMAACPPKSIHFQEAVGHAIGLPFSWILLLAQAKEVSRALTRCLLRSTESVCVRNNEKIN
jgi:hypothetical protein